MKMKRKMQRLTQIVLVTLSALAVTACGLRGSLERPPPLWGDPQDHTQSEEAQAEDRDESGK